MTIQTRYPNPPRTGATTVYLSAGEVELARTLGGGNASAGVRLALATQVEGAPTANALLIAQAPALLAELRRAQAWVAKVAADYDGDDSGLGGRASKQLDRMVAVIAAATGEEDWL